MPWNPQMMLQPFEKQEIDFVGPIKSQGKTGARYIVTATEYQTCWAEAQSIKDCTTDTVAKFLFEHVLTRFGCLKILMSDRGTHSLNETISALTEEFQVYHQKSTLYHPQANGTVEAFNKILETALTKVCNAQRSYWDLHTSGSMGLQDNVQETDRTNTYSVSLWHGSYPADGIYCTQSAHSSAHMDDGLRSSGGKARTIGRT